MIDLEKILEDNYNPYTVNRHDEPCYTIQIVKDAMREAILQALELAAEEAKIDTFPENSNATFKINKQSILNCINKVK